MALKKIDPMSILKTVSSLDPAIDAEATGKEGMKKFSESYDMSVLKFKKDEFPTIFHLRNLISSEEAKIKQAHMKVEFPEVKQGMSPEEIKKMSPKVRQVDGQEMWVKYFNASISCYEEQGKVHACTADTFPFNVVQEMGTVVMLRTQVGDDLKNVLGS